jgi:hypothetical protein
MKDGYGIYYYKNGWKYEGEFKKGKKFGKGKIIKNNGDYYEVIYEDDKLVKKGEKLKDVDGTIKERMKEELDSVIGYEEILDIKKIKEGKAKVTYTNGDTYEGEFKNNLKDGKGIYDYKNGDRYESQFKSDLKEGKGIYIKLYSLLYETFLISIFFNFFWVKEIIYEK